MARESEPECKCAPSAPWAPPDVRSRCDRPGPGCPEPGVTNETASGGCASAAGSPGFGAACGGGRGMRCLPGTAQGHVQSNKVVCAHVRVCTRACVWARARVRPPAGGGMRAGFLEAVGSALCKEPRFGARPAAPRPAGPRWAAADRRRAAPRGGFPWFRTLSSVPRAMTQRAVFEKPLHHPRPPPLFFK